ncbi:unnamed protein product [Auanema sp. JU1783]|nr:unnamed protein product [Auanema sp. JU1783]
MRFLATVVLILATLLVVSSFPQLPFGLNERGGRGLNNREFLRSYNMHNVNTLAALSRYGDMFEKRFIARE